MRALIDVLREHVREDHRPGYYATVAVFLTLALGLAVSFDVEGWIDEYFLDPLQIPLYVAFYAVPWVFCVVCHACFHGQTARLREARLWLAGLAALLIFAVYANFHYYLGWISTHVDPRGRAFVFHCAANLVRAGLGLLFVAGYWRMVDRGRQPLYGLVRGEFRARPHAVILLVLALAVGWASAQPEFLATYPRHEPGPEMALWGLSRAKVWAIFEICYGADFVFTELFFRGLLVLGFTRWLGPGAVMPMTAWYAFIHVSKPLGELIGSVFGGWALGVLALRTRSIFAGLVLHLGLAYMMELAAIVRKTALAP